MLNRLLGESAQIRDVRDMVEALSAVDVSVLIQGEIGTGKALVARIIHEIGPRSGGPFISLDRAVADPNVLELILLGQERSAFTGAHQLRIGKFEAANQGTIFLGEIGDLHPALQAKLLHVLEDGQVSRVGGLSNIKVDVRVIAATNQDLERAVRAGRFREDLYYRLNTVHLVLPPLRERSGDVVILAEHFLAEACERSHRPVKWLTADAQAALVRNYWPGNVLAWKIHERTVTTARSAPRGRRREWRGARHLDEAANRPTQCLVAKRGLGGHEQNGPRSCRC